MPCGLFRCPPQHKHLLDSKETSVKWFHTVLQLITNVYLNNRCSLLK
jgi:hypothetical protein